LYDTYVEGCLQQVDWASNNTACQGCQLVPLCAERGIHTLMKIANITDCISPAKTLENKIIWE